MGNLFGVRRRAPQVTAQDRAVLQLKQQRDKIRIYQKRTETDLKQSKDLALKLFQTGQKDRALIVLRRKKYMEEIIDRTDRQLETLEQLVSDIEYTQIEVSVVEGLKVGTAALKQLNSLMNIDDIQRMMEDNEEAAEKQKEISDILQRSTERYDEQDLMDELQSYLPKAEISQDTKQTEPKVDEFEPDKPVAEEPQVVTEPVALPEPATEPEPVMEGDQTLIAKLDELPDVPELLPEVVKKKAKVEARKATRQMEPAQ